MTRHGELDNGVEETYAYGGRPRDDYGHDPERSDYYYDHDGYHDELAGYPPGYGQTDYTQLPGYETGPVDADYPYPQTGGYPLPPVARAEDPRAAVHPPPPPMPPPPAAPAPPPAAPGPPSAELGRERKTMALRYLGGVGPVDDDLDHVGGRYDDLGHDDLGHDLDEDLGHDEDLDHDDLDHHDLGGPRYGPGRRVGPRDGHADDLYDDEDDYDDEPLDEDDRAGRHRHGGPSDRGAGPGGLSWSRRQPGRGGGGRGRAAPKLVILLVVVAVVLGGGIFLGGRLLDRFTGAPEIPDYPGPGGGEATVTVVEGATATDIAKVLFDAGVVKSEQAFITAAANDPENSVRIQPGTYVLKKEMRAVDALAALLDPSANVYRFTIPEGRTVDWIITELSNRLGVPKEQYEAIVKDPAAAGLVLPDFWEDPGPAARNKLEGYLFPTTYNLNPDATPVETLQMMVDELVRQAQSINLVATAASVNMTAHEIITVASIIEGEVPSTADAARVAEVIYNRLNDTSGRFRTLGMDSTTRYVVGKTTEPLTESDLRNTNPYNTSAKNPQAPGGLPPGAINNPGLRALTAALNPAHGTAMYFVSMPDNGETKFASTSAEFDQLMAEYYARGGTRGG